MYSRRTDPLDHLSVFPQSASTSDKALGLYGSLYKHLPTSGTYYVKHVGRLFTCLYLDSLPTVWVDVAAPTPPTSLVPMLGNIVEYNHDPIHAITIIQSPR